MFLVYIIAGMILLATIILMALYHDKSFKMTSETIGEVISAEDREIRDDTGRREETLLLCKYRVGANEYEVNGTLRGKQSHRFPPGKAIPIKYNPANPGMSRMGLE